MCTNVAGCDRPDQRLGFCVPHNQRRLKYGDPLAGPPMRRQRGSAPSACSLPECDAPARLRGWCESHHRRWQLYGDPRGVPEKLPITDAQRAALDAGRAVSRRRFSDEERVERAREAGKVWARQWRAANPEEARRVRREQMSSYGPEYRQKWNNRNRLRRLSVAPPNTEAEEYAAVLRGDPCSYCGALMEHIDHIEPIARGGNGEWWNLTAACAACNQRKATKPLLMFMLDSMPLATAGR